MSDNNPDDGLSNYERAMLNLMAGIEAQLSRVADRLGKPEQHVTTEQVAEAWPLRMYQDQAGVFLKNLGITVD
jgi:hypothetical protein